MIKLRDKMTWCRIGAHHSFQSERFSSATSLLIDGDDRKLLRQQRLFHFNIGMTCIFRTAKQRGSSQTVFPASSHPFKPADLGFTSQSGFHSSDIPFRVSIGRIPILRGTVFGFWCFWRDPPSGDVLEELPTFLSCPTVDKKVIFLSSIRLEQIGSFFYETGVRALKI